MFRRNLSCALATLALALAFTLIPVRAHAALTEIRKDFVSQTAPLSATAILTAPSSNASYLVCLASDVSVSPTLRWTDENGVARSWVPSNSQQQCNLIRNEASTAPTLETSYSSGTYNLFAFGLGFWTTGSQGQGGLSETSVASSLFLVSVDITGNTTNGACTWELENQLTGTAIYGSGPEVFPLYFPNASSHGFLTLTGQLSGCTYSYNFVNFGTPASGSGPLTDYEYNLLSWTNAVYPNYKTVFSTSGIGVNTIVAANIAEVGNGGTVSEGIGVPEGFSCPSMLGSPSGAPASCVWVNFQPAGTSFQFQTFNSVWPPWGASPTYSAEVDVIQF